MIHLPREWLHSHHDWWSSTVLDHAGLEVALILSISHHHLSCLFQSRSSTAVFLFFPIFPFSFSSYCSDLSPSLVETCLKRIDSLHSHVLSQLPFSAQPSLPGGHQEEVWKALGQDVVSADLPSHLAGGTAVESIFVIMAALFLLLLQLSCLCCL